MDIRASAPGKIILMGEHAAVYGRPALVAAVNRRVTAVLSSGNAPATIEVAVPQLNVEEEWTCDALREYAGARRRAWLAWRDGSNRLPFADTLDPRPSQLVAVALGEALQAAGETNAFSARLEVRSELPVGAGFGSSAAAASAIVLAVLRAFEVPSPLDLVEELTLEVERRQHGTPSGIDGAAVVRGGVLWASKGDGGLVTEPVQVSYPNFFNCLHVAHTGPAAESTGEVVSAVRRLRESDPARFDAGLDLAASATRQLRDELENPGDRTAVVAGIRRFSAWLHSLGVVPDKVRDAIAQVEAAGGAAKISGAGSLCGPGAGSFLIYHPEHAEGTKLLATLDAFKPMPLRLGAAGARIES